MISVDISIIIPVFNRAYLAKEAIASVAESTGENLTIEILVIDDGSNADEAAILENICTEFPACQYFRLNHNSGPQVARNFGLQKASGSCVKFLDSDDLLLPGLLAEEHAILEQLGSELLVSGWLRTSRDDSKLERAIIREPQPYAGNPYDAVLTRFGAPISAVLYKKSAIGPVQWDASIRHPDDWFFLIKVLLREPRVTVRNAPVFVWRDHDDVRQSAVSQIEYAHARFKILDYFYKVLQERDELTPVRRQSLADYFYIDIYIAQRYDRQHYRRILNRLDALVGDFQPSGHLDNHLVMRFFGPVIGYRRYIPAHNFVWRCLHSFWKG